MNKAVRTRAGIAMAGTALLVGGLTACGGGKADAGTGAGDGGKAAAEKAAAEKAHSPVEAIKASYLKTVAARFAKAELSIVESDGRPAASPAPGAGTRPATT
ncbi:hypothetical protein ACIQZO_07305 [Streptomyces sp. NPDC097617]|uniref:hypothetical protein n=1 Tax=Streptomyces sp. NPDC097617 TaxID=3366091 RepID=UPI0038268785